MKKVIVFALALAFAAFDLHAHGFGKVQKLLVGRLGNQVLVKINGSVDPVSCRSRTEWHYFLTLGEAGSKEIYAALLTAKTTKQNVRVVSRGKCDSTGQGLELISYVILE